MLNREGFDLWADGYDRDVGLSDEDGSYPFAGYREILGAIYRRILAAGCRDVLESASARACWPRGCIGRAAAFTGRIFPGE